jgi:hypothetical protein
LKSQSMLKIMRSSSTTVLIALVELATTFYLGRPTTIVLSSSLPLRGLKLGNMAPISMKSSWLQMALTLKCILSELIMLMQKLESVQHWMG